MKAERDRRPPEVARRFMGRETLENAATAA